MPLVYARHRQQCEFIYFLPEVLQILWHDYDFVVFAFNNLHPQFSYLLQNHSCGGVQVGWNIIGTCYDCFSQ